MSADLLAECRGRREFCRDQATCDRRDARGIVAPFVVLSIVAFILTGALGWGLTTILGASGLAMICRRAAGWMRAADGWRDLAGRFDLTAFEGLGRKAA